MRRVISHASLKSSRIVLPLLIGFFVILISCRKKEIAINEQEAPEFVESVITEVTAIRDTGIQLESSTEPISYLALGDSYTIGQSVDSSQRWPVLLTDMLNEDGLVIDSLKIIAQTGWTTSNLQNAINAEEALAYDLVSLLIGVNNQFQGLSFTEFQSEFDILLSQAESFSSENHVFVVSIPDYGVTPFGAANAQLIAEELDEYNFYMREEAYSRGIPFIDITQISRELGDNENALANDNLHPSGFQYQLWAEEIKPVVLDLLNN